jgi:hypothetical protein
MSEVKVNKISPRTNCGTVTVGDSGDSVSVTAGVPVTVNGDLKSNALKATDGGSIISQCGTSITLGASGDTINLAAGATQSGFGRTGTVDWDTTAKTASFTAVSGNGYFVNTTSGAVTVTLPASPSAGDIVALQDYAGTWGTNNVTIGRNGSNIGGTAVDPTLSTSDQSITLVYVDSTRGWQTVNDSTQSVAGAQYVTATGGTVLTCGDFKTHVFTGPGTFTVSCAGNAAGSNTVCSTVVAGGGGGGFNTGGGGGAGQVTPTSGSSVAVQSYTITVGAGGPGQSSVGPTPSRDGSVSSFGSIVSATTGKGGLFEPSNNAPGGASGQPFAGGVRGNAPSGPGSGGGGGGAGAAGTPGNPFPGNGGAGGIGLVQPLAPPSYGTTGPTPGRWFGGGGGGGGYNAPALSSGGAGGGGSGGTTGPANDATAGTVNTGGGGGGGAESNGVSKAGGSGIVIIRYKFQN